MDPSVLVPAPMLTKEHRGSTGLGSSKAKELRRKIGTQLKEQQRSEEGSPPSSPNNRKKKEDKVVRISKKSSKLFSASGAGSNVNEQTILRRRNITDKSHWQKDSSTNKCFNCQDTFGVLSRKHHCRKCGEIICESCSNYIETTQNDFIFESSQKHMIGVKVRFCCQCNRKREVDSRATMAQSYSTKGKGGMFGLGVVPVPGFNIGSIMSSTQSSSRQSNISGIPIDDTAGMVKAIMQTPIMAYWNRTTDANSPPMYVGHLKLIVKNAQNLPAADLNGKADPYVKIYLRGKTSNGEDWDPKVLTPKPNDKGKTSIKYGNLFPVWNEQINFKIPRADAYLQIEVWDHDTFTNNEEMCSTSIELEDIMAESVVGTSDTSDGEGTLSENESNSNNSKASFFSKLITQKTLHKVLQLKDKKTNEPAGQLELAIEFNYNLGGYLLSRYWPEQEPKKIDPDFSANRTIKNIKDLLNELQPYIEFVVDFVGLMAWNDPFRSTLWLLLMLFVTYYPRFMFPLINLLFIRKMYYHYKKRVERIASFKQNSKHHHYKCDEDNKIQRKGKGRGQKNGRSMFKRLRFGRKGETSMKSNSRSNGQDDEVFDDETSYSQKATNKTNSNVIVSSQDGRKGQGDTIRNTEISEYSKVEEDDSESNEANSLGFVVNGLVGLFKNETLKSIQNYIGLVVRILRTIRHLWDWNSPVLTTVMAVILSLSFIFHSTILNFKYTWITLILYLFLVLTPVYDYALWGILRSIPNIETYLKVKNSQRAQQLLKKAQEYRQSQNMYRENEEDEDDDDDDDDDEVNECNDDVVTGQKM